jgi:predicted nucleic acid-binding protein
MRLDTPSQFSPALVTQIKKLLSGKNKQVVATQVLTDVCSVLGGKLHLGRWMDHLVSISLLCSDSLVSCSSQWTLKSLDLETTCSNIISRLVAAGAVSGI